MSKKSGKKCLKMYETYLYGTVEEFVMLALIYFNRSQHAFASGKKLHGGSGRFRPRNAKKSPRKSKRAPENCHRLQCKRPWCKKDLGVTFDSALTFSDHVADIAKRANIKLGILKRAFSSLNERGWLKLYKSIIRPTLEYCSTVWCPMLKKDEDLLEKVQQRATRQLPHLRHLEYPERLKALGLETLAYRRQRAEVLQMYKIMKGIEHLDVNTFFQLVSNYRTRGHSMKVKKPRFKYCISHYFRVQLFSRFWTFAVIREWLISRFF